VSREFGFFSSQQRRGFVEDVFEACPIPPIVVVSMELECNQEVLEAVIIKCKILSCEKSLKRGRQPRFVVDISGSRVTIDGYRLWLLRAVGVHALFARSRKLVTTHTILSACLRNKEILHSCYYYIAVGSHFVSTPISDSSQPSRTPNCPAGICMSK
jgi:hypothetical protein